MTTTKTLTTTEVAARFSALAKEEKWFEIQDELFSTDVTSTDPIGSPFMGYAEGKGAVRKKGEDFIRGITAAHHLSTGIPIITGSHFAVTREIDITHQKFGRIQINQIMLYSVKEGQIISEKFFY